MRHFAGASGEKYQGLELVEDRRQRADRAKAGDFLFFDPDRSYHLAGRDADGVVEVSAYKSEDGPDENGFGREIDYDWWYLDDNLCPVPGADCLHSYSNIGKRANKKRFQEIHDMVVRSIARRKAANR